MGCVMKTILLGGPHDGQILDVSKAQHNLIMDDEHIYYRVITKHIAVFASVEFTVDEVYPLIAQKLVELAELKQQIAGALGGTENKPVTKEGAKVLADQLLNCGFVSSNV